MTTDRIANAVTGRLDEFLDGYVLVAYVAGTQEAIVLSRVPDPKTCLALNALMMNVIALGGVSVPPNPTSPG